MSENEKAVAKPAKPGWKAMVFRTLFFLLGNMVLVAGVWQHQHFKDVSVATMIFQLRVPLDGADGGNFSELFLKLLIDAPLLTLLFMGIGALWRLTPIGLRFLRKHIVVPAVLFFVAVTAVVLIKIDFFSYVWLVCHPSRVYEEYYVNPAEVAVGAPENLRNLVYIYLESMETSYADRTSGGVADVNRIPFLTRTASADGEAFSAGKGVNGMYPVEGAVWTCGSLISQTCGLPLLVPPGRNAMGKYSEFLKGACSIGEVLGKFGYNNIFLQGSAKQFGGTDHFLATHGYPTVLDYFYFNAKGKLPYEGYYVWWGFEDSLLYEYAKEEIVNASKESRPFAVTLMTIDTHYTDGYKCSLCGSEFDAQYDNVIRCADRQVEAFVTWLQAQDFYENTTVIIVGDHPTMDSRYYSVLSRGNEAYQRKAYTVILNSAVSYELGRTRRFSAFDMYPTTLAAMGFEIPGNRLGLGVNLYSDEETLVERMGLEKLNKELLKHSKYYNKHIIEGK